MENILMWTIIIAVLVAVIGYIVYQIIKISKMPAEQRKEMLIIYLKGLVCAAERAIGDGNGPIKLQQVEEYFHKNASWFIKGLLFVTGTESLHDLIEVALKEVKEDFGGK